MRPSKAPTSEWVRLSIARLRHCERSEAIQSGLPRRFRLLAMTLLSRALLRARLFLDLPGLALGDERLEVGALARGGGLVLLDHRGLEGRRRIFADDAQRDREAVGHFDQHRRDTLVLRLVDQHRRIVAVD